MAFQAVPDGIEVVFEASQNGVPVVNVYNVQDSAAHTTEHLTDLCEVMIDWWRDNLQAGLHNSYVLNSVKATSLELATGPQVVVSLTSDNQGAITTAPAAGNAAAVISWRTASIGRSYRGRTYVGGLSAASFLTAQHLTTADVSFIADAAAALLEALQTFGAALCVLSRYAAGVLRVTGVLTEIISIIVDQVTDSQRRRTAN
jgi:hypothetical protein